MAENKPESLNIGNMLKEYSKAKRIYKSAWARHQQVGKQTVLNYMKKPTMQTATLWNICHVLKHNFFADLAAMLPAEFTHSPNSTDEKIAALEKENERLKIENDTLWQAIRR